MNKKSGLADSPFFRQPAPQLEGGVVVFSTSGKTAKTPNGEKTKSPLRENAERRNGENGVDRMKVRQGIDVYRDQIVTLNEMQFEVYKRTGKKPRMGEMVRNALDEFIARKRQELNQS